MKERRMKDWAVRSSQRLILLVRIADDLINGKLPCFFAVLLIISCNLLLPFWFVSSLFVQFYIFSKLIFLDSYDNFLLLDNVFTAYHAYVRVGINKAFPPLFECSFIHSGKRIPS